MPTCTLEPRVLAPLCVATQNAHVGEWHGASSAVRRYRTCTDVTLFVEGPAQADETLPYKRSALRARRLVCIRSTCRGHWSDPGLPILWLAVGQSAVNVPFEDVVACLCARLCRGSPLHANHKCATATAVRDASAQAHILRSILPLQIDSYTPSRIRCVSWLARGWTSIPPGACSASPEANRRAPLPSEKDPHRGAKQRHRPDRGQAPGHPADCRDAVFVSDGSEETHKLPTSRRHTWGVLALLHNLPVRGSCGESCSKGVRCKWRPQLCLPRGHQSAEHKAEANAFDATMAAGQRDALPSPLLRTVKQPGEHNIARLRPRMQPRMRRERTRSPTHTCTQASHRSLHGMPPSHRHATNPNERRRPHTLCNSVVPSLLALRARL